MSVSSATSRIVYTGNNSLVTAYAVPFYFEENAHLNAIAKTAAGVETVVTLTNVTGAGDPNGGTVRTAVAVPATSTLTIYREVPFTQTTSYAENDAFPAESHERALDKLTTITQQLERRITNCIRGTEATPLSPLPSPTGAQQFVLTASANQPPSWQEQPSLAVGPVTATGSTQARFLSDRFADAVNVKDFGAAGDGVTDDSGAISLALSFGKPVRFPAGTYLCASNIPQKTGVVIYGEGPETSVVQFSTSSGKCFDFVSVDGTDPTIIRDISVTVTTAHSGYGIYVDCDLQTTERQKLWGEISNVIVQGADIQYGFNHSIYVDQAHNFTFDNILTRGAQNTALPSNRARFTVAEAGLVIAAPAGAAGAITQPTDIVVTNCRFFFAKKGLHALNDLEGLQVSNSIAVSCDYGFLVNCETLRVWAVFDNCHSNSFVECIGMTNMSQFWITSCLLYKNELTSALATTGVRLTGCEAGNVSRNIFINNKGGEPVGVGGNFELVRLVNSPFVFVTQNIGSQFTTGVSLNETTAGAQKSSYIFDNILNSSYAGIEVIDDNTADALKFWRVTGNGDVGNRFYKKTNSTLITLTSASYSVIDAVGIGTVLVGDRFNYWIKAQCQKGATLGATDIQVAKTSASTATLQFDVTGASSICKRIQSAGADETFVLSGVFEVTFPGELFVEAVGISLGSNVTIDALKFQMVIQKI